jgi:hypothetical protein
MLTNNDNEFEKEFKKSLRQLGELFPVTDADVESFEANNSKNEDIPDSLKDPNSILKRGKIHSVSKKLTISPVDVDETITEFRMVARNGIGNLPNFILNKMLKDRKKAEDDNDTEI